MQKQQDLLVRSYMGTLNKPKRQKSDQTNQQKNSPQDRARRAAPDPLFKKRLQWLEDLNSEVRQNFSG